MSFGQKVIDFHFQLSNKWKLPEGVELIYPFGEQSVRTVFSNFYLKYFNDSKKRYFLFGINPGRFGAGVTGVPFTDPLIIDRVCGIKNDFRKQNELSSLFVYDFIRELGGPKEFYSSFYISSVCPLGFINNGKNYNYYDDNELFNQVKPHIINNIQAQKEFGCHDNVAFCLGKGKNLKFMSLINDEFNFFEKIVPLPHPRWVMQYRLKSKHEHLNTYLDELSSVL
jgi:hypothetical protein